MPKAKIYCHFFSGCIFLLREAKTLGDNGNYLIYFIKQMFMGKILEIDLLMYGPPGLCWTTCGTGYFQWTDGHIWVYIVNLGYTTDVQYAFISLGSW